MDADYERLKTLDLDTIRISSEINGYHFAMEIQPVQNCEDGMEMSVDGYECNELSTAVKEIQKILKGWKAYTCS